jgi:hypothetical protein
MSKKPQPNFGKDRVLMVVAGVAAILLALFLIMGS